MATAVASLADLDAVRNDLAGDYVQTADIDASPTSDSGSAYWRSGRGWEPIGNSSTAFTGIYDGGGHSVDGLFINRGSLIGVGLFGYTNAAAVQNLAVTNANVTGRQRVGALIGNADTNTTITGCSSTGAVDSAYTSTVRIGGLVGTLSASGATCTDCWSSVTVTCASGRLAGGLIGQMSMGSSALRCYATGDVTGKQEVGGFVGHMHNATISNCYTGHGNTVTNTSTSYGGGFAGYAASGNTLRDCYCATIDVDCQRAFSGESTATHIDCFYDSDLANKTQTNVTGKTTAEMKALATFSSAWSIARVGDWVDETWVIGDSDGDMYPELAWAHEFPTEGTNIPVIMAHYRRLRSQ